MAKTYDDTGGGGKKKRNKTTKVPQLPQGYNPFARMNSPFATTIPGGGGMYGYAPPVQSLAGGMYSPFSYYFPRTVTGPDRWGYAPDYYGGGGGGGGGSNGGGDFVGYFPGLRDAEGNWIYGPNSAEGNPLGGGWGNRNFVYGKPGEYEASYYGERAYGISDLNVNQETGELQGSLNKYGQPLGTEAPFQATGARRAANANWRQRKWQRKQKAGKPYGQGGQGGGRGEKTTPKNREQTPIWYNDLINWNI